MKTKTTIKNQTISVRYSLFERRSASRNMKLLSTIPVSKKEKEEEPEIEAYGWAETFDGQLEHLVNIKGHWFISGYSPMSDTQEHFHGKYLKGTGWYFNADWNKEMGCWILTPRKHDWDRYWVIKGEKWVDYSLDKAEAIRKAQEVSKAVEASGKWEYVGVAKENEYFWSNL